MRDNFSHTVKQALAARVGYCCSNPDCCRPTSGPNYDAEKAVNIGVAAHISAASSNGPRYNPAISSEERKFINNAIWLCQNCAKLIDSDETHYTIELLQDWKRKAEDTAQANIQGPNSPIDFSITPGFLHFLELLMTYIGEQEETHGDVNIPSLIEWIRSEKYFPVTPDIKRIIEDLRINPSIGASLLNLVSGLHKGATASATINQMSTQMDQLYNYLLGMEYSQKEKHRIEISSRLLEIASRNLVGVGMRSDIPSEFTHATPGTTIFRWRVSDSSPEMMLLELVGGVLENRISIILHSNNSLSLRVFDPIGRKIEIKSMPFLPRTFLIVGVTWSDTEIAFWIHGKLIGKRRLQSPFSDPWVMLLAGIDIEGNLSADTTNQGYEIDGLIGLNLGKDNISHGAQMSHIAIYNHLFAIENFTELARISDLEVAQLKMKK